MQPATFNHWRFTLRDIAAYVSIINDRSLREGVVRAGRQQERDNNERQILANWAYCPSAPQRYSERRGKILDRSKGLKTDKESPPKAAELYSARCGFQVLQSGDVQGIFGSDLTARSIKEWVRDPEFIGGESVYGYALGAKYTLLDSGLVLKAPRGDTDLLHETIVGLYLSELRYQIPTFAYVFGGFECAPPFRGTDGSAVEWCHPKTGADKKVRYIVYEKVENAKPVKDFTEENKLTLATFLRIYLQVLLGVRFADEKYRFAHYDMHWDNVLVREEAPIILEFPYGNQTIYIPTQEVVTIIDFGMAQMKPGGVSLSVLESKLEAAGVLYDRYEPLHDAVKLLCFVMRYLPGQATNPLFNQLRPLLAFFTPESAEAVVNDNVYYGVRFIYPTAVTEYLQTQGPQPTISQYISYVLRFTEATLGRNTVFTTDENALRKDVPFYRCRRGACISTGKQLARYGIVDLPAPRSVKDMYHRYLDLAEQDRKAGRDDRRLYLREYRKFYMKRGKRRTDKLRRAVDSHTKKAQALYQDSGQLFQKVNANPAAARADLESWLDAVVALSRDITEDEIEAEIVTAVAALYRSSGELVAEDFSGTAAMAGMKLSQLRVNWGRTLRGIRNELFVRFKRVQPTIRGEQALNFSQYADSYFAKLDSALASIAA